MFEQFLQLLVNGVVAGTLLAVPAIGFTAMYAVLRFANFSVASHATIGAFAGYAVNVYLGMPAPVAVLAAFFIAGISGVITDELVLRPLRPYGALTTAIASIALTLLLENVIRFGFGNDLRGYDLPIYRDWHVFDIRIGRQQLTNMAMALFFMTAVFLFFSFTRFGKAMRAVSDNPMLAGLKGIDVVMIGRLVSLGGMGLVGVGGILMGWIRRSILLPVFASSCRFSPPRFSGDWAAYRAPCWAPSPSAWPRNCRSCSSRRPIAAPSDFLSSCLS